MKVKKKYPKKIELFIIESLSNSEKKTGTILYNEVITYKKFQEPILSSSLIIVNSKKDFILALRNICNKITSEMVYPILHIETHGSEEGFHLSNDEILTWKEFFNETRSINILLNNNLIIILSMCYGISLLAKVETSKRAAFRAAVACSGEIKGDKLLEAYEIFYNNFFFSFSGDESVIEVNKIFQESKIYFTYLKSETIIDLITDIKQAPDLTRYIINDIAIKEKASNPIFTDLHFNFVKKHVKNKLEEIANSRKSTIDYFLMKDIKGFFRVDQLKN